MKKLLIAIMMISPVLGQGIDLNQRREISNKRKSSARINSDNRGKGNVHDVKGRLHSVTKYKTAFKGVLDIGNPVKSTVVYFYEPVKQFDGKTMNFRVQVKSVGLVILGASTKRVGR